MWHPNQKEPNALGTEIYVVEPGRYQQGLAPGLRWLSTVIEFAGWPDEHPPAVRGTGGVARQLDGWGTVHAIRGLTPR